MLSCLAARSVDLQPPGHSWSEICAVTEWLAHVFPYAAFFFFFYLNVWIIPRAHPHVDKGHPRAHCLKNKFKVIFYFMFALIPGSHPQVDNGQPRAHCLKHEVMLNFSLCVSLCTLPEAHRRFHLLFPNPNPARFLGMPSS